MQAFERGQPTGDESRDHRVRVVTFDDDEGPAFVACCSCGKISPPLATENAASQWGREHDGYVEVGVEVLSDEGGAGWACMFCGSVIEDAPLRVSVSWTDDGADGQQWYAAHRRCLTQRLYDEAGFAPRFDVPGRES